MNKKKKDSTNNRQKVEISQILEYLVHTAGITEMPDRAVLILNADPKEMLGTMITGGVMRTAVIIYRMGNYFNLFNASLKLVAGFKILRKAEYGCYELETFGRELLPKRGGWNSSEFMNHLFIKFEALEKKVEEKFEGEETIYYKMV